MFTTFCPPVSGHRFLDIANENFVDNHTGAIPVDRNDREIIIYLIFDYFFLVSHDNIKHKSTDFFLLRLKAEYKSTLTIFFTQGLWSTSPSFEEHGYLCQGYWFCLFLPFSYWILELCGIFLPFILLAMEDALWLIYFCCLRQGGQYLSNTHEELLLLNNKTVKLDRKVGWGELMSYFNWHKKKRGERR